jgi:hypothetical protein
MPLFLLASMLAAGVVQGAAGASPPDGPVLRAEAGLGGFVRPGRWTPVRIRVENKSSDLVGEILVEWGDAQLHRAIDVPAPSRTVLELYVRTLDVRGSIAVHVIANGEAVTSVDIPVRAVDDDERLVLCVGAVPPDPRESPCSASMPPEALPNSMRGYVAADEVRLPPGAESRLTPAQRTALHRWRAYHEIEARDLQTRPPQAPLSASTPGGVGRASLLGAWMTIALSICCASIWMRGYGSAWQSYMALAAATGLGVACAVLAGRFGPGAQILVRHSTTVEQVADGGIVSMRGTIEYPAFAAYAMHVSGVDGALTLRPFGANEQWLNDVGAPVRRGTFGRGAHDEVEIDGVAEYAPFRVREEGSVIRVSNVSDATLSDCSFPEGFSERRVGTLAPGQTASARATAASDAPFFSCLVVQMPVTFSDVRFPVRIEGVGVVSVRLPERSQHEAAVE